MGKRSDFERVERDFYPTPYEAVLPLTELLEVKDESIKDTLIDDQLCINFYEEYKKDVER